jgi:hypothetical protein
MRVGAVIVGLIFLLLIALGVGAVTAALVVVGLVLLTGAATLVSAFAARSRRETAERSPWAEEVAADEPGDPGDALPRPSHPAAPYIVTAIAAATVFVGFCGVRFLDATGDPFDAPASLTGSIFPTATPPITPTSTPQPPSTPNDLVATTTPEMLPTDRLAPDEADRCPPGRQKHDRC